MKEDIYGIYDFLKKCDTYYLATLDGDQPRVRPFGTVDIFSDGQIKGRIEADTKES